MSKDPSKKSKPDLTVSVEKVDFDRIAFSKGDWTYSYSTPYRDKKELPKHLAQAKLRKESITIALKCAGSKERFTTQATCRNTPP